MSDPLASARLKVERADQHAHALKQTIERWRDEHPYSLSIEKNGDSGKESLVINIERQPPTEWSVVTGEVVHHLRSALDHAVYALSAPVGGEPPHGTEFPIFKDEPKFQRTERPGGRWKARGLGAEALAVVESVQPFHHGKDPLIHPLWVLQELSNADKHRLLHTTGTALGIGNFTLSPSGDIRVKSFRVRADGPVKDGTELASWTVEAFGKGEVTVNGDIAYGVALDEAGPARGEPIEDALDKLIRPVASIITMLAKTV